MAVSMQLDDVSYGGWTPEPTNVEKRDAIAGIANNPELWLKTQCMQARMPKPFNRTTKEQNKVVHAMFTLMIRMSNWMWQKFLFIEENSSADEIADEKAFATWMWISTEYVRIDTILAEIWFWTTKHHPYVFSIEYGKQWLCYCRNEYWIWEQTESQRAGLGHMLEQALIHGGPRFSCPSPTLPDEDDVLAEDSDLGSDLDSDERPES